MNPANSKPNDDTSNPKTILVKKNGRIICLSSDDILYVKAEGNISLFKIKDGSSLLAVTKNIGLIYQELQDIFGKCFVKCHRSFLVNKDAVSAFCSKNRCLFVFNQSIPVSRRNRREIFMQLAELGIKDGN